jgi:hypothetical protein
MKMRGRLVALLAGALAAAFLLGACEDQAARRRAEVQRIIAEAGRELGQVPSPVSPDDERFDAARQKLNAVLGKLAGATEGEAGQQGAAALLAAGAQRKLASLSVARIQEIEAEHQRLRFLLHSEIDAALRLDALASGREQISTRDERMMLDDKRQELRARLHEYSERVAQLDGPIAERTAANTEDTQRAESLEEQANSLRREASHRGHAEGLSQFEKAVELEREADRYEYRVAQRENDLRHDLQPERTLAESRIADIQETLGEIQETEASLAQRDTVTTQQAQEIRESVAAVGDRIREALTELGAEASGELAQAYTEALNHLEKAVTEANRAASKSPRGEGDAARLMVAQVYNQQGRLHWTHARDLADQMTVLQRLVDAGPSLGDVGQSRTDLEAIRARREEAIEQATAAFNNAKQQLEQIHGGGQELAELKQRIDESLAALAGQPIQPVEQQRPTRSAPPTGSAATGGFESPEELLAFMNGLEADDFDGTLRLLDAVHATSETSLALMKMQRDSIEPSRQLAEAIKERFGEDVYKQFQSNATMGLNQNAYENPRITDRTDTRATVAYSNALVPEGTFDIVLLNGSWMIDGDTLYAALSPAMTQQLLAVMPATCEVMGDIAARIRDGEFATADAALQALMTEIAQAANRSGGTQPPG